MKVRSQPTPSAQGDNRSPRMSTGEALGLQDKERDCGPLEAASPLVFFQCTSDLVAHLCTGPVHVLRAVLGCDSG